MLSKRSERMVSACLWAALAVGMWALWTRPPQPPKPDREGVSYVFSGGAWQMVGPEGVHAHAEDVMRPACDACRRLRGVEGEQAAFRVLRYLDEQHRQQRASVAPESSQ